eukprot:gene9489-biopygen985
MGTHLLTPQLLRNGHPNQLLAERYVPRRSRPVDLDMWRIIAGVAWGLGVNFFGVGGGLKANYLCYKAGGRVSRNDFVAACKRTQVGAAAYSGHGKKTFDGAGRRAAPVPFRKGYVAPPYSCHNPLRCVVVPPTAIVSHPCLFQLANGITGDRRERPQESHRVRRHRAGCAGIAPDAPASPWVRRHEYPRRRALRQNAPNQQSAMSCGPIMKISDRWMYITCPAP